jgi:hypothetical protein
MINPETALTLISTAIDLTTRAIIAVQRHRRNQARRKASKAAAAFWQAAERGGMTSVEVRELMAESGFLIGGRE